MVKTMENSVRTYSMASGIVFLLLGIIAISMPLIATFVVQEFIGVLFMFGAICHAVNTFQIKGFTNISLQVLLAVCCFIAGYFLFAYPLVGALTLTSFLAAFFLVKGFFRIFASFKMRAISGWQWVFVEGLASIVIAYIIYSGFPGTAAWAIGLIVGVDLMIAGISTLIFSNKINQTMKTVTQ